MSVPENTTATPELDDDERAKIRSALVRYRFMAWFTGLWLLLLTADIVLRLVDIDLPVWIPIVHGWVYLVYFMITIDLAIRVRWPVGRTIGTLLAGTIPFLSFFVEHWRTQQVKADFGV